MRLGFWVLMAALVIASGAVKPAAAERSQRWTWVRLEPRSGGSGWDVRQGLALVHLDPTNGFHTELDVDAGDLRQHYRINGSVKRGRLDATEVLLNSDAAQRRYFGEIDEPGLLTNQGVCLHLHSGPYAIHLCQEARP